MRVVAGGRPAGPVRFQCTRVGVPWDALARVTRRRVGTYSKLRIGSARRRVGKNAQTRFRGENVDTSATFATHSRFHTK